MFNFASQIMATSKNETAAVFMTAMHKAQSEFKTFLRNKFRDSGLNLTFEMLQVLNHLWVQQGVNQQEIANLLHKDKASVTYLVDNLSKRGLVQRSEDSVDRRNRLITLTAQGLALKKVIRPWIDELFTIAGRNLTRDSLKAGVLLFGTMRKNLLEVNEG